ncbi:MAG: GGDEF domain-containing protein [Pseudomonadales bacterium]|nr:GGDEF domain-containing protein [Pseudomonadales bacterium]
MTDFEQDLQKYQRQLDKGFAKLRFEHELEEEFMERYFERNLAKQRTALIVAFILMLLLAPLDYQILKDAEVSTFYTIVRMWLTTPLLLIAYGITFLPSFRKQAQHIAFLVLLVIGIGANAVGAYAAAYDLRTLYEGIILIIFVGYLLAGLRFRYSVACNTIIGLSYLAFGLHDIPSILNELHNYFFIFGALLIGGAAAFTLEYQQRLGFLQRGALRNSAKIDPLTGLLNRGAINQSLETIVDYARREKRYVSLLLVDVDHFKKFNDFYGHLAGDSALVSVANSLAQCCRRSLDFAGRYGGEEYILVWFDTKPEEADSLCALVREKIDGLKISHQQSPTHSHLTVSGGLVTTIPSESTTPQSLVSKADELLYEAKDLGRNRIKTFQYRSNQ